jgi:hypothetical protein
VNTCEILKDAETIAVVGISSNSTKTSRNIARYLVKAGYRVVGVNPTCNEDELEGVKIYKNLRDIPHPVDIVDVFRRSEDIPALIADVIEIKPKALWLQSGIRNDEAVKPVADSRIIVIQDTCIFVAHSSCF